MKPKYEQLADKLREEILAGTYPVGALIPSENALQEAHGLSRHTVRQAIAVLANEGYLRKERGSGTYVSLPTVAAAPKRQKTIGVIMTYLSDYIFPSIIRGIEQALSAEGYSLLLGTTNNDHQQERQCLERMMEQQVAGIIIEPTKSNQYNPNLAYYVAIKEAKIPFLMINAFYEELDVQHLCVNDTKAGYLATKELIDNGHTNTLLLAKIDDLQGKYRMKGFIKAIEEADLLIDPEDIVTYTTETKDWIIETLVERLAKATNQVTGIVAYNDEVATLLIDKLSHKGFQVPEDFSVIGTDDAPIATSGRVPLTTVTHPQEQMGQLAAEYLIANIEAGKDASYYFEPTLVKRGSVKKLTAERDQ